MQGLLYFACSIQANPQKLASFCKALSFLEFLRFKEYFERTAVRELLRARKLLKPSWWKLKLDSRKWMIGLGYLKLLAGINDTAPLRSARRGPIYNNIKSGRLTAAQISQLHRACTCNRVWRSVQPLLKPHSGLVGSVKLKPS